METEDKYEQALERARVLYNAAKVYDFTDDMKKLEYIFPELCEKPQTSEDEVQYNRGYDAGYIEGRAFTKEELEKQNELSQKSDQDVWSEEFEKKAMEDN